MRQHSLCSLPSPLLIAGLALQLIVDMVMSQIKSDEARRILLDGWDGIHHSLTSSASS